MTENRRRVVITGMGCLCGNAADPRQMAEACAEGVSGIRPCTLFDTSRLSTDRFGEIPGVTEKNRLFEIIRRSVTQMQESASLDAGQIAALGTACRMFYGTLLSNADTYLAHSESTLSGEENNALPLMNEYAAYAADIAGVRGLVDVSSAACAAGTTAVGMAFDFIRCGLCECAVAGGADALNRISAYGFHALKALSGSVCRPYDESRDGITIGECGAFFMVESLEHALARGAGILCELAGYALGNDAYHITSPEPEGREACHTMAAALADAGIGPEEIDYINGHGTGTVLNDSMEVNALNLLFAGKSKKPHVSSTKALLGHCMGASGAIELAGVIGMIQSGRPLRMPDLTSPINGETMFSAPESLDIRYAMSNSFGFAGNSASLIVRRYDSREGGSV